MSTAPARAEAPVPDRVSFAEATKVWAKIGLLSFGGPAGQIALMHRELCERRRWIDDERFFHALSYCTLLPGPEAQQLATYIGWLMHRTRGGLVAGTLFVLPGFLAILALSIVYATLHEVALVGAIFYGLKAAVAAIVVEALFRVGKRALRTRPLVLVAAVSFVAIFFFDVPFPAVVLTAGVAGGLGSRLDPAAFPLASHGGASLGATSVLGKMEARGELTHAVPSVGRALRVLAVALVAWALPFVLLVPIVGTRSVFVDEALFFSRCAMVTFGGAYAVLAYVAQEAVGTFGWLAPGEMLDGLGLAETTPGPLIMVVEFVGFVGAYRAPGELSPVAAGVLGAVVTTWVTFVPCFLWIFLGAPFVERLRSSRALAGALSAITAAVVGVILNLSLWFALHVAFRSVTEHHHGPLRLLEPELASADLVAIGLTVAATVALMRFRAPLPLVLALSAVAGALTRLL